MEGEAPTRVTMAQFQAVASPTRIKLMVAMRERRLTVSQLSALTEVAKSTTHGNLELLESAGLVRREEDPERVWVYYELTPLGESIARSNPLRLVVFYAAAVTLILSGVATIWWDRSRAEELPWNIPPIGVPPEPEPWIVIDATVIGLALVGAGLAVGLVSWLFARRRWAELRRQFG